MEPDWVQLQSEPLDTAAAIASVGDGRAGGIAIFLGTTRREKSAAGQELIALDYEAYPEMALAQMQKLAETARSTFAVSRIALLHRVGRVGIGQPSVLIAVSTPHRDEAFSACRWLIDTLKAEVAIWKREIWSDGTTSWVDSATSSEPPRS